MPVQDQYANWHLSAISDKIARYNIYNVAFGPAAMATAVAPTEGTQMDINTLAQVKANPAIPEIKPGDRVKVSSKVVEGERERLQPFEGVVIRVRRGVNFTVRRVAYGIGVERTFPFASLLVEKVEVLRHAKVRRAKLYYLRGLSTKASRLKERRTDKKK